MRPICDECGTEKVPVEENSFACPTCGRGMKETPHTCDYCHAHVASMPSDDGAWICDYCIMQALVGPAVFAEILAVQAHLAQKAGHKVTLGDAFTEWRQLANAPKITPTSPVTEVNAPAG